MYIQSIRAKFSHMDKKILVISWELSVMITWEIQSRRVPILGQHCYLKRLVSLLTWLQLALEGIVLKSMKIRANLACEQKGIYFRVQCDRIIIHNSLVLMEFLLNMKLLREMMQSFITCSNHLDSGWADLDHQS